MNDTDKQLTKEDILKHRTALVSLPIFDVKDILEISGRDSDVLVSMLGRFAKTFGD